MAAVGKSEDSHIRVTELLRDISLGQSRIAIAEPDHAVLMRLADDPLLVSNFLRNQMIGMALSCTSLRRPVSSLMLQQHVRHVSFQDENACTPERAYLCGETLPGTSLQPFHFAVSPHERELCLEKEGISNCTGSKWDRIRLPDRFTRYALLCGAALVMFILWSCWA